MSHVVVIGAGQAGFACAAKLRQLKFAGHITIVGDETALPYQRPPLSKAYLLGDANKERLYFRPESFYDANDITLKLGASAQSIDPEARCVCLSDGQSLNYDVLVIATGASPNPLPTQIGGALGGVYSLRSLSDVDTLAPEFKVGAKLVIIGGGYIGLEAAAVARKRGLDVSVIEMAPRILQRVAAAETADYIRALHQKHGVRLFENARVTRLLSHQGPHEKSGFIRAVELSNIEVIDADFVITGIGVSPNIAQAQLAGVHIDQGIACDVYGQTSHPQIWAAGDCASCLHHGQRIRIESVGNAIDQAEHVAQNIMGAAQAYVPKPWFWSDQYDCKLQIAGLNTGYTSVFVRATTSTQARSHWYYKDNTLICVDAINDPRSYMVGKRLIEQGLSPSPEQIEDPNTDLKSLLTP